MKAAIVSLGSKSSIWTADAMKKHFDQVDMLNLKEIQVTLGKDPSVLYKGEPIEKYDCIFAKGSFRYSQLLQSLTAFLASESYMPISDDAFTIVHDKLLTHLVLQKHNVPMPKTYITPGLISAKDMLKKVKFPIVMKFPKGTGGKGVMFAESYSSASSLLDAMNILNQPILIQEYVDTGGRDNRLFVCGNKVVAAYTRIASKLEKRSNIHSGGHGEAYLPDNYTKKIAISTAKALKSDMIAIDMLETIRGPLVVEANLSPGLQGITECTGIDVADKIACFLREKTDEFLTKQNKGKARQIIKESGITGKDKQIITNLDFRGTKILLPEIISEITKFDEHSHYVIDAKKGELHIKILDIN